MRLTVSIPICSCIALLCVYLTGYLPCVFFLIRGFSIVILKILSSFVVIIVTVVLTVYYHKPKHVPLEKVTLQPCQFLVDKTMEKLSEYKYIPKRSIKHKALISRNVDDVIDELIALLLRDYINSWYSNLVREQPSFFNNDLKPIVREMLFTFRNRCQKIDDVKFFTCDIVEIITKHMQNLKNAAINPPERIQPYKVYPFLQTTDEEVNYLRKICEFLLVTLLPTKYAKCLPVRHLLREIFAQPVFYNVINKTCDPDTINLRLISYLERQEEEARKHVRTYAYAETYEDFIKMIEECGSVDSLERMRYYIVSEILQATTISNVKRAKGMDADREFNTQKRNKGDLLEARNLSRYLNQLRFAKTLCEKRLKLLGGPDYLSSSQSSLEFADGDEKLSVPGRKVLSMSVIIQSSLCRKHFSKFLQKEEMHSLLGFWEAVEEMKVAEKSMWHQLGNDVVQMYIYKQSKGVRLSKNTLKGIEEFMLADKGLEAFFQAQEEVFKHLEENYYHSFIVSDIYHKMVAEAERKGTDFSHESEEHDNVSEHSLPQSHLEKSNDSNVSLFDHTSYTRNQLKLLQEKLNDKLQALNALRSNPKCERKVISKLDKEIQDMCSEQNVLQNHIEKTELWIKYLGLWQATVVQADVIKENDKNVPYFNIMVHLSNEAAHSSSHSVGWIVSRSLNSFHSLHQKLVPAAPWLRKIGLPTKPRFKTLDKNFLEQKKMSLQTFISAVTKDDGLNKSEALYCFLNPSPEYMKHPPPPPKKPFKFNIFQIFKGVQNPFVQADEQEEEELFFLDTDKEEDTRDSIAEPLYILIGEIFELKGMFSWLRKSLIIFVQLTYGKTINRQLKESVSYILSEPMLLSYLQMFRDTMWPTGNYEKPPVPVERTSAEQLKTKCLAKKMLLHSIPETVSNLIGQDNAKKGVSKIFDALQDQTLNKQLLYYILEAFLYEYAPELRKMPSIQHKKSKRQEQRFETFR